MQRNASQQGRKGFLNGRHLDHIIGDLGGLHIALGDQSDNDAFAGFDLLHIGNHFFVLGVLGGDENHRHFFVNQGNGAVLHFGSRVPFGVDVGYFLEFESAFQGHGELVSPSQVKEIAGIAEFGSDIPNMSLGLENFLDQRGDAFEFHQIVLQLGSGNGTFAVSGPQGHLGQYGNLGGEGFGGGHPDFGTGMGIGAGMGGPGYGGTNHIANAQDGGSFFFGHFDGGQGIGRFSGLRDGDDHVFGVNHRVSVPEFGGVFHLHRGAGKFFEEVFPNQTRMPRCTTSNNENAPGIHQFELVFQQTSHLNFADIAANPSAH